MRNPVKKYSDRINKPKRYRNKKKDYKRTDKHKEKPYEQITD